MTPLHYWAIAGAGLGLALPVLIHLLTKPRGERHPLPTFQFLSASANFSTRRSRLRAVLILSARALALALLALGFARLAQRALAKPGSDGATTVLKRKVIVLDCSMSMRSVVDQVSVFDKARQMAQQVLAENDTGTADLILAAKTPRAVFGQSSSNLIALKDEAAKAHALPEALDAAAALDLAARSFMGLSEDELKACEVVVISDLQRGNWIKANFSKLPKGVPVRVLKARGNDTLPNIAIVKAGVNGLAEAGAPVPVFADLANFGALPADIDLELSFDGRSWTRHATLAPGARTRIAMELPDVAPGWRHGQFSLKLPAQVPDALPDDNRFPICVKVREARRVALITSERVKDLGGPAYFMEAALAASPDATVQVARYLPAQLEGEVDEALQRSDLLVIVNAGQLSDGQSGKLARLITAGTPVLVVAQTALDADNLKALQSALGAAARLPVQFSAFKETGKSTMISNLLGSKTAERDEAGGRFLVWVDTQRRPFNVFGEAVTRFTQNMRVGGGITAIGERDEATPNILARYSDGSAALLIASVAAGKLAVLNAAVGGDGRHLGTQPLFVPLIQELSQELLESGVGAAGEPRVCGSTVTLDFKSAASKKTSDGASKPAASTGLTLTRVGGGALDLKREGAPVFRSDATAGSLTWSRADEPGVYLVESDGATLAGFAVAPPSEEEGDLTVLDDELLKTRLAQDRTLTVVGSKEMDAENDEGKETSDYFFIGALAFLFAELGLLKIFKT